jgi:hypothetical protein
VAYARADVPVGRLLAPLLDDVRHGRLPTRLPGKADLDPAATDIEVPYLGAWQAVELLAERHGEAAVRRLLVAGSSTGTDAQTEAATDAALEAVLGTSRADLTAAWRERLAAAAG